MYVGFQGTKLFVFTDYAEIYLLKQCNVYSVVNNMYRIAFSGALQKIGAFENRGHFPFVCIWVKVSNQKNQRS